MMEATDFQKKLGSQTLIHPLNGNPLKVYKAGKNSYINLFVSDDKVYVASENDNSETIGMVIIKNVDTVGEILPTHKINITEVKPYSTVGEII